MADTVKVRIALQSARELELDVTDGATVATLLGRAIEGGESVLWVTDVKGNRHGIVVAKIAFVEIEGDVTRPGVGFAAG